MVEIRTNRTRNEIEADLHNQGFEMLFDDDDDQIWTSEEQDEMLFVSWVNCDIKIYKLDKVMDLL